METISTSAPGGYSSAALNPVRAAWIFPGSLHQTAGIVPRPGQGSEETFAEEAAHKVALLPRAV